MSGCREPELSGKSTLGMVIQPTWMMSSSAGRVTVSGANCDLMQEDVMSGDFDVIVIGTGAGGGTLAHTIAQTGKRILLLERGDYLPKELDNWEANAVFVDGRYISSDIWYDGDGTPFQPQIHYFVGGATKMYGAALYRLRPEDFGDIRHVDGFSPAWPVSDAAFEPWYTKAEWLYHVHGRHGEDPT